MEKKTICRSISYDFTSSVLCSIQSTFSRLQIAGIRLRTFYFLTLYYSCSGDLWSGSEGGVIRIWPWETVEKSLFLASEEWHMATLLVERSCIDLQSQLSVNGFSNILTSDVKYLLADNSRAKVWSAGYLSFALWYVLTFSVHLFQVEFCYV